MPHLQFSFDIITPPLLPFAWRSLKTTTALLSAQYGRMALGRCVDEDIGHLGCSNDAVEVLDELCSGKSSCQVNVAKQTKRLWRDGDTACPKALMGYLDVEYNCKQGMSSVNSITEFCV